MTNSGNELNAKNIQQICRLSPMQEGIFFHALLDTQGQAYFCQNSYRIHMPLQESLLEESLQTVVNRHDILRTVFSHEKTDDIIQIVLRKRKAAFHFEDISHLPDSEQTLAPLRQADRERGFNLAKDMLLRLSVYKLADENYELVWSHHHIILDGWSAAQLMAEFVAVYRQLTDAQKPLTVPPAPQFSTYIQWLQEKDVARSQQFWQNKLQCFSLSERLPGKTHNAGKQERFNETQLMLPADLTQQVAALAARMNMTVNTVYQAAWSILLSALQNSNEVVFGCVTSVKPPEIAGIERMLGLFINTVPVCLQIAEAETVETLLTRLRDYYLDVQEHQFLPLHTLQAMAGTGQPLIDHVFIMENFGNAPGENATAETTGNIRFTQSFSQTNYNFNIILVPGRETELRFNYNENVFDSRAVKNLATAFQTVLQQMTANTGLRIAALQLLSRDRQQIQLQNGEGVEMETGASVLEKFGEAVERHPQATAICDANGVRISYKTLHENATRLATSLVNKGYTHGSCVGVYTGNTAACITAILAVFYAGAVYVPLNPSLPGERLKQFIADAGIDCVLTIPDMPPLRNFPGETIAIEVVRANTSTDFVLPRIKANDTAYIIFTSGTTGKPKGVPILHKSLASRIAYHNQYLELGSTDKILQFASVSFDASLVEIFMALTTGATLVLIGPEQKENVELLTNRLEETGVTAAIFPPAYLKLLEPDSLPALKNIISTGEAALLQNALAHAQNRRIINGYGPTETCVGASFHTTNIANATIYTDNGALPLGRPFENTRIYILNKDNQLLPEGWPGEICIAGRGLTPGYLHLPALTQQRLAANPFAQGEYAQLYRTGDKGYWNAEGELEFCGRLDQQVQLNGIRVEPAEIERQLLLHEAVAEALVTDFTNENETRLLAYIVPAGSVENILPEQLMAYLAEYLPAYMIPAEIFILEKFPLTPNGKTDRNALPKPLLNVVSQDIVCREPEGAKEEALLEAIKKVIRKPGIGMAHHFLQSGGDSIKAIQLVSQLHRQGWKLELKEVFLYPLLYQMAGRLTPVKKQADQSAVTGELPLSAIQCEFFERDFLYPHRFNQSVLLESDNRIDPSILRLAAQKLTDHHDALRILFPRKNIQFNQGVEVEPAVDIFNLRHEADPAAALWEHTQQLQEGFSLAEGPLFRIALFQLPENDRLFILAHHLIVDGISWRILLEDLIQLYTRAESGAEPELPLKTDSFRSWTQAIKALVENNGLREELAYWEKNRLTENDLFEREDTGLPAAEKSLRFELDATQTTALLGPANRTYNTETTDMLLAALAKAAATIFHRDTIAVVLEGHGREAMVDKDISRTVGWFTSVYPVLLPVNGEDDGLHICQIKEQLRNIPQRGAGYGVLKYLGKQSTLQQAAEPQMIFNYLGQFDNPGSVAGIRFATEATARGVHPQEKIIYPLQVSAMVAEDKLVCYLRYDASFISAESAAKFHTELRRQLEKNIQHCLQGETRITPSDLAVPIFGLSELYKITSLYKKESGVTVSDIYPLSPMQKGMLFHELMDRDNGAYIFQLHYHIQGTVNADIVKKSVNRLTKRHDILRTVFRHKDTDEPMQLVLQEMHGTFQHLQWNKEEATQLTEWLQQNGRRPFNLEKGPLFRVSLIELPGKEFVFVWTCHHILMDGWCMGILIGEFKKIYAALAGGTDVSLPYVPPYRNYIKWLHQGPAGKAEAYWLNYLQHYDTPITLGYPAASEIKPGYVSGIHRVNMEEKTSGALRQLAADCETTLNVIIQAAWGILLSRYNNSTDVVFGSIVSGRPPELEGIEQMIGLFINIVPVRVRYQPTTVFINLVKEIHRAAVEAKPFHYTSLAQLQANTSLKANPINHFVEFENYPVGESLDREFENSGWHISGIHSAEHTSYDFSLTVNDSRNIAFTYHYNQHVYTAAFVQRLAEQFMQVLNQAMDNRWIYAEKISLHTPAALQQLLQWSEGARKDYPVITGFSGLFTAQVKQTPNRLAVSDETIQWSYVQLWQQAAGIAMELSNKQGIGRGNVVGLCMERSARTPAAILAIWMLGAVYLPLEPALPADRMQFMLEDSGARLIIVEGSNTNIPTGLPRVNCTLIPPRSGFSQQGHTDVDDLTYIIYTSGSTGTPKGVMVKSGGMLNHLYAKIDDLGITAESIVAQTASLSFDISIWQLVGALLTGGRVHIMPKESVLQLAGMMQEIETLQVTHWQVVPVYLSEMLQVIENREYVPAFRSLQYMVATGEALKADLVQRWTERYPAIPLVNAYGPTEASDDITHAFLTAAPENGIVPIGKPLYNLQVYVADRSGHLCAPGVGGEILVGGIGLAKGYTRAELNKGVFVDGSFYNAERIYRTGDWGYWLPSGELAFIGRIDNQVKINGYRIEPEEIEQVIATAPGVEQAVVLVHKKNTQPRLVCFLQWQLDIPGEIPALKNWLKEKLPVYMVPSEFHVLNRFPININGKIDRAVLMHTATVEAEAGIANRLPASETEKVLLEAWKQVLRSGALSVEDNFFDAGGDSIRAIQICSRMYARGYKLQVRDIFEAPTVADLALKLEKLEEDGEQAPVSGPVPLTPVQQRFFSLAFARPHHYNQSLFLSFNERVQPETIQPVAAYIFNYHDMLRAHFEKEETGSVNQWLPEQVEPAIQFFDWKTIPANAAEVQAECNKIQQSLQLENGEVSRWAHFSLLEGDYLLLIFHHLVIDGVSWRILLEDFSLLLQQSLAGEPLKLPRKSSAYREWGESLIKFTGSSAFQADKKYWLNILSKPAGRFAARKAQPVSGYKRYRTGFTAEETTLFTKDANRPFGTDANDLLLCATGLALREAFGFDQVFIDLERHGREPLYSPLDFSRTLGWFTSIFPFYMQMSGSGISAAYIKEIKESLRRVPGSGVGYGLLRYRFNEPAAAAVQPEIIFNYLGQFDEVTDNGLCHIAALGTGQNLDETEPRLHKLNISGFIAEGELSVNTEYDAAFFTENEIAHFSTCLQNHLRQLLDYCVACTQTEKTASDFGYNELSTEDLSMINNLFN